MFFIVYPFNVDVPMERWPWANWAIMLITILVSIYGFGVFMTGDLEAQKWMLFGAGEAASDAGLLGSVFTHEGFWHLFGNMAFLFVFGNAVNAKLGHALYIACYLLFGALASLMQSAISDTPGLGASGAIAGIMGMFIVFFPKNNVVMLYAYLFILLITVRARAGTFLVSAWVVIGLFFARDVLSQALATAGGYEASVGYMAHIGGTLAGFFVASILLIADRIRATQYETTLLEMIGLH